MGKLIEFLKPNSVKLILFGITLLPLIVLLIVAFLTSFPWFELVFVLDFVAAACVLYLLCSAIDMLIKSTPVKIGIASLTAVVTLAVGYFLMKAASNWYVCDPVQLPPGVCDPVHRPLTAASKLISLGVVSSEVAREKYSECARRLKL